MIHAFCLLLRRPLTYPCKDFFIFGLGAEQSFVDFLFFATHLLAKKRKSLRPQFSPHKHDIL